MRVLIADDDPTYRALLEDLLTKWHFEPVTVADGAQALDAMGCPDAPPLLLLDWDMPRVNGFEVAKTVRSASSENEPYVLMVTSCADKESLMRIMVCGADDYLIKPFDPTDLKIHLRCAVRIINLRDEVAQLRRQLHQGAPQPQ
ncbi:MAG: response regulator transcription factor [Planctomycetota bacterium]|nr:response regulator transcription factor [Planctomycetota bacterium]